jgi:hypothetical protein
MNRFRDAFAHPRVVLPVVHIASLEQALRNTGVAIHAGADGVFLINHAVDWQELLSIHARVKQEFPACWAGVNCLDLSPTEVFEVISDTIDGVWVDNAGVDEGRDDQPLPDKVLDLRRRKERNGLYFGGVAFKYQGHVDDLAAACRLASRYMDVVTTSGPGTGHAAAVEKIETMKRALGDHPLAIASGITPDNIGSYLPHCDCFLVATGISETFDEFNPQLVQALVDKIRAYAS